jgi:hypothetical protein
MGQTMTRIRVAVADWLRTTRVPVVLLAPFLVAGAIVWIVAISLFIMFVVMVPVVTIGMFGAGWDMVGPGWDLIILAVCWAIWWPVARSMTR